MGLAQSKTLARMALALVNAKRLGLRWPGTAFLPRRGSFTFFRKQNRHVIYGHAPLSDPFTEIFPPGG
jgi:hypothetical protein